MSIRRLGPYWAVFVGEQALFTSVDFPRWAIEAFTHCQHGVALPGFCIHCWVSP